MDYFLPFYSPKNQNEKKMKKTPGDVMILHVYQKLQLGDVPFLRYDAQQTDQWTDGRKK